METALSTITILPSSKEEMQKYYKSLKNEILEGNNDPLFVLKHLKYAEKVIGDILKDKDIETHFLLEAEKYSEKTFDHSGVTFTIQETGVSYDYASCGDSVWDDLNKQAESIKEQMKIRETMLKTLPYEGLADTVTGEIIKPPLKSSKTKVAVRL